MFVKILSANYFTTAKQLIFRSTIEVFVASPLWLVNLIKRAFPYRDHVAHLSKWPPIAWMMDRTIFKGDDLIFLPKDRVVVQQAISQPGNIVLPSALVDHFIEKASHHWIMNFCICREGDNCQDYPHDLGCVFLGEAVQHINSKLGRLVSKEEALAHVRRARELGLVHLIGRDRIDNLWLAAGPFGKLLTICNCCPCCCLFRVLPELDPINRSKVTRMEGVSVSVNTQACVGCGKCARDTCFVRAIEVINGKARISEACRGCGRCVEICPQHAIQLRILDSDFLHKQIRRISNLVDVGVSTLNADRQVKEPVQG